MSRFARNMLLLLAGVLPASSASAGLLSLDPNALTSGSVNFANGAMTAVVDYAVFDKGDFTGFDPSGGTEYVYTYQLFNTSTARNLDSFSVGLLPGNGVHYAPAVDSQYPQTGGVAPLGPYKASASVVTYFNTPGIAPGGYSQVVLFTSPYGPSLANVTVQSAGLGNTQLIASPVPEPASLGLLGLLAAGLLRRRSL